ncbi:flavin reductase family protein [Salinirussus salinus]|jgi:flavin reductase (DIM6/NTAB) family NADH-FMN oxidoreductase RutF|uniref:flavin reductase family protein n=1 Tax=Salinirussus salinus TaxID=1198300 RepID=UPI001359D7FA|nr:flavin reductase family protein [Salinirussus salinus]
MEVDPRTHERSMYRTLTGTVVPRPIGWVSTTGPDGTDNLAPYSFFTVASVDPPVLLFSTVARPDRPEGLSDTARNARETGEFVLNVVTEPFAEAMNETSATLPPGDSEFDHAGLERAASTAVEPPRVAGVEAAYECQLYDTVEVGSNTLVLGEVVYAHLSDGILTDEGKVDVDEVAAVGRLAGSGYCYTRERFRMERPD